MLSLLKRKDGYSLIEMFLVLMILLVFSITVFSLILLAGDTYDKLVVDKNTEADARIIMSTYNTRIRQYDYKNGCRIENINWQNDKVTALVLKETASDDNIINTWLLWHEGTLWESLTINEELPSPENSQVLFSNNKLNFKIRSYDKLISIRIDYPFSGSKRQLETNIYLRSIN